MDYLQASKITARVIAETAGTIKTNGIQELDHTERGGVSSYSYVYSCIVMTAYNALRALPGFSYTVNDFYKAVEASESRNTNIQHKTPEYVTAITDGDGITRQLSRPIRLL